MARKTGRWKPGQSGNPNGRPPKAKSLTDLLRNRVAAKGPDGKPNMEAITDKVMQLALAGERWAVELIYDRLEGKPAQALELTGDEAKPVIFRYLRGSEEKGA